MLSLHSCVLRQGGFTLNADIEVPTGVKVAVIGPSGGGKSTLLSAVAGFLAPVQGDVAWDGAAMPTHPGDRPLTMLFQDHNLFPHLTVFQNVAVGCNPTLRLTQDQRDAVAAALGQVGLADKSTTRPSDLSGGQRGRVALARVIVRQRPLLLLDEPFAALGPALKDEMLALLDSVVSKSRATVLMVTHDPQDALRFADQTILVADGVAHAPHPTKAFFDNPPAALAEYLGDRG